MDAANRKRIMEQMNVDTSDLISVALAVKVVSGVIRSIYSDIKKITDQVVAEDSWNDDASKKFKEKFAKNDKFFELHVQNAEGLGPVLQGIANDYDEVTDSAYRGVL